MPISICSVNTRDYYTTSYWPTHRNQVESGPTMNPVLWIPASRKDDSATLEPRPILETLQFNARGGLLWVSGSGTSS